VQRALLAHEDAPGVTQRLVGAEAADRDLQHGADSGGGQALCHIGGHTGLQRGLDLLGRAALGEERLRAGFIPVEGAHGFECVARRIIKVTDDHIRLALADARGQIHHVGRDGHNNTATRLQTQAHPLRALGLTIHQ